MLITSSRSGATEDLLPNPFAGLGDDAVDDLIERFIGPEFRPQDALGNVCRQVVLLDRGRDGVQYDGVDWGRFAQAMLVDGAWELEARGAVMGDDPRLPRAVRRLRDFAFAATSAKFLGHDTVTWGRRRRRSRKDAG